MAEEERTIWTSIDFEALPIVKKVQRLAAQTVDGISAGDARSNAAVTITSQNISIFYCAAITNTQSLC